MDIVFLASWYPSRLNPELGNFVQRHAEAVAFSGARIKVVHVAYSNRILFPKMKKEIVNQIEIFHLFLPKISLHADSLIQYWLKIILKNILKKGFNPELIHCHVAYPAGDIAIKLSEKLNLPLVSTEHWSRFDQAGLDEPNKEIEQKIRKVSAMSSAILPVSNYLAKLMQRTGIAGRYQVIYNCVNTQFFYPISRKHPSKFTFLHISNFEPGIKNTEGIIEAFSKLKASDAQLIIAGDGDLNRLRRFCESKNINTRNIRFQGKLKYLEVAKLNQESDCLVLFSNFENLPCVIAEAHCCGNPVLASNVGGIPEMIDSGNGKLIDPQATEDLTNEMEWMIQNYNSYDKPQIAKNARLRYGYQSIGNAFLGIYSSVLADRK